MLDDKSKQRYKVKISIIEGYDPYQIKKEELSGNISKFPPVANPDKVTYFLFSLSLLTEEKLKAYKSIRMGQGIKNKIVWRSYLGYWMNQYLMYFLLHATFLYLLVALCLLLLLKSRSAKGASCHPAFMGNCLTVGHTC